MDGERGRGGVGFGLISGRSLDYHEKTFLGLIKARPDRSIDDEHGDRVRSPVAGVADLAVRDM